MITPDGDETCSVQELIDKLLRIPENKRGLPVMTEGCDCVGPALGIHLESRLYQLQENGKYLNRYIDGSQFLISRTQSEPDTY
jgi:hypothetical protein